MRRSLVALAVSGALVAGLFAGSVLGEPGTAVAQETTEEAPGADVPGRIQDVLDGLVADGTLTEAQADAVAEALAEIRPERGMRHGLHRGHVFGEIAGILGMEREAVRDALAEGATIADLAADAGMTTDDVVAALLVEASDRIADAVEAGRIDAAEAETKLAEVEERLTALVNGEIDFGERPHRHGPRFGRTMSEDVGLDA